MRLDVLKCLVVVVTVCGGCGGGDQRCGTNLCGSGYVCVGGNECHRLCYADMDCRKEQACVNGVCDEGAGECDADEQCTQPSECEIAAEANCVGGACVYAFLAAGVPCNDFDVCTQDDACSEDGRCVGAPVACDPRPIGVSPGSQQTNEDSPLSLVLTGKSLVVTEADLTVTVSAPPAHGTVTPMSGPAPLTVIFTPAADYRGDDSIAFTVTDSASRVSEPVVFAVSVAAVNDAPDADTIRVSILARGTPISGQLTASDVDGDSLTYTAIGVPQAGTLQISATGAYTYTPGSTFQCTDQFVYSVSDPSNAVGVGTVTVTWLDPEITTVNPSSGKTGVPLVVLGRRLCESAGTAMLGDKPAQVLSWTDEQAVVLPSSDYVHGAYALTLTRADGVQASSTYTVLPWIESVHPRLIASGDTLTLTGSGFGDSPGIAIFAGLAARVTRWTSSSVELTSVAGTAVGSQPVQLVTADFVASNVRHATVRGNDVWVAYDSAPSARNYHTAVWTGMEMIIWGGSDTSSGYLKTGGRYSPSTDTWVALSTNGAPAGRAGHTATWTGSQMIVWGGYIGGNSGGRYNPITDTWVAMSTPPGTVPYEAHTALWTGTEMIVWGGGSSGGNTGGRYNPSGDTWVATSVPPGTISPRWGHTAVWTGQEMIVWGGASDNTGGRYTPGTDAADSDAIWVATSTPPEAVVPISGHTAVWTGKEMVVWGGTNSGGSGLTKSGGRYTPGTDAADSDAKWVATSAPPEAIEARSGHTAVWTGKDMIVWGGVDSSSSSLKTGGRYSPSADTWGLLDDEQAPDARRSHTAVWTGTEMIVWGGYASTGVSRTGGRYAASNNRWTPTRTVDGVSALVGHTAVWTGSEMIAWGGVDYMTGLYFDTGTRYAPSTDTWVSTSTDNAPAARAMHTAVFTGTQMIVWGGGSGFLGSDTGGRYDPTTDTWLDTSTPPSTLTPRSLHTAVWTGTEMIIWGGSGRAIENTGGRYNPSTDTWVTTLAAGAPSARYNHTATWTGTQMIVWGGYGGGTQNTGSRYTPGTNETDSDAVWAATSTSLAPSARQSHTAVWTGTQMIVWGGTSDKTGGRYNPSANTWVATSLDNAPTEGIYHSAVWTGAEMIVWGGRSNTGGRYTPGTISSDNDAKWVATSTLNAPVPQDYDTAVWTGSEMIVVGVDGMGRYLP